MDTSIVSQYIAKKHARMAGIYQIRQISTGRKYIGSAVELGHRFSRHRYELNSGKHANLYLQRAWDKYSDADFLFEILEAFDELPAKQEIVDREQWYLDNCITWGSDFNMAPIAYSPSNVFLSDETREKIRKAATGRKISEAGRQSLRDSWKRRKEEGFRVSDEARKNQSLARIGKKHTISKQGLQNIIDGRQRRKDKGLKNKPLSDETKRRMSEANRRRREQGWKAPAISDETRRKMSEANKRSRAKKKAEGWVPPPVSDETRRKMSEAQQRRKDQGCK